MLDNKKTSHPESIMSNYTIKNEVSILNHGTKVRQELGSIVDVDSPTINLNRKGLGGMG